MDVRGGGFGDVVGGLEGGAQLGDGGGGGGGGTAQGGHHVEEVVGAALAGGGHALHRLGGHFGGALHAGARARVLAPEQGQEAPVKLGKHTASTRGGFTPPSPSDAVFRSIPSRLGHLHIYALPEKMRLSLVLFFVCRCGYLPCLLTANPGISACLCEVCV